MVAPLNFIIYSFQTVAWFMLAKTITRSNFGKKNKYMFCFGTTGNTIDT